MVVHSLKKIYKPLAGDVVTYEDEGEGECMDHDSNEKVHVRVSANTSALIAIALTS